jgi:cytochrome P450
MTDQAGAGLILYRFHRTCPAPFRVDPNMLVLDPPAHDSVWRVVSAAFTPRAVARLERAIERRSKQIVARAAAQGEFDFVRHVAAQLPLRTIAHLFGLPLSEHDSFVVAADAYVGSGFPAQLPGGTTMQAFHEAQVAYLRTCAQRSPASAGKCPPRIW